MTLSRRTADVLVTHYGIERRKIVTVAPGANFDDDEIDRILARPRAPRSDFLIGYSGIDYRRKGLPKLAEAVMKARQAGAPLTLRVIGARPPELENQPGFELIGMLDKSREASRLIELMAECQLGCLLSFAEGLPISLVEFLRFGIPVIGTRINGIPDVVTEDVGLLVEPDASVGEISVLLTRLAAQGDDYRRLRENAQAARHRSSWRRAAEEIRDAMAG
jgi:glycosyltransferase involved in cell wall biosynthesis